jgi:alpha-mannosidase
MNNHWETNYKADQEGLISFAYAIRPHAGGYDPVAAQRFGRDTCQPLLVVPVEPRRRSADAPLELEGDDGVLLTSLRPSRDGQALMARLFNVADGTQRVRLRFHRPIERCWISNPMEHQVRACPETIELSRFEIVTIRAE